MARRPRACGPLCRLKPAFQAGAAIVVVSERHRYGVHPGAPIGGGARLGR